MPLVEERLALIPQVDIFATYNIDEETDSIKIIVNATMLETVSGSLKFNVYILEDSVTGTGAGWDQANTLHDRAGWEFSPYFSLPNPVTNYYHRNVVRNLLGGAWGVTGEFTNPAEESTVYVHEFNAKLDPAWNKDMIEIVAFVTNDDTKECLNVCYGDTKPPTPPVMELTTQTPDVGVLNEGDTFVKEYFVKNIAEVEHQFQITMNVASNMPQDWNAELPNDELSIAAGETESFIVRLTAGATIGIGEVKVAIASITDPTAPKTSGSLIGISSSIENFEVLNTSEEANSVLPFKTGEGYYFNIGSKEFSKLYDKIPEINSVIWNLGDADALAATDVSAISGLVDDGVDVLLLGYKLLSSLNAGGYLDDLGLEYYGYSQEGYVDGYDNYACFLKGVENDPLTGSMFNKILYLDRKCKEVHVCKITDQENVFPLLTFKNDQTIYTTGTNTENCLWNEAMCGFRINKGDTKIVLIGINPLGLMVETYRDDLINKPLEWFAGAIDVEENKISTSEISVIVSPNPVGQYLLAGFSLKGKKPQYCNLTLVNTLGQEIATILNENINPGNHSIKHNVSGLTDGTYYLVLKNAEGVHSTSVVILK
ncbi:MAG: Omp28-related outer membrane protein [bacterium]